MQNKLAARLAGLGLAKPRLALFGLLAWLVPLLGDCLNVLPTSYKIYDADEFHGTGGFYEEFGVSQAVACEAARRTLLSQGYVVSTANAEQVVALKSFQPTGEEHVEINFHVVCIPEMSMQGKERTTVYAAGVQDRYALSTNNSSASLGLPTLGSVSVPLFSTGSSLVKVGSATILSADFYERFFALVQQSIRYHYQLYLEQQQRQQTPAIRMPAVEAPPSSLPLPPELPDTTAG